MRTASPSKHRAPVWRATGAPRLWRWLAACCVMAMVIGADVDRLLDAEPHHHAPAIWPEQPARITPRFAAQLDARRFLRGTIHSHSAISDGDSPAAMVLAWYRRHGYQFAALTDHNRYFAPSPYRWLERPGFVLLGGEEVTMAAEGLPIHVNALCTERTIGGRHFDDRVAAVQFAVDEIRRQGGVALINHPNFYWALDAEHLAQIRGRALLELHSGHPHARSDGDARHPSVEQLWDQLLERGSPLSAVAVDDMHILWPGHAETPAAYPATAWIAVYGAEPHRQGICRALAAGRLYASTGPELERLQIEGDMLRLCLDEPAVVEFIGRGGELLGARRLDGSAPAEPGAPCATYRLQSAEHFVRVRVRADDGGRAWTQPFAVSNVRTASHLQPGLTAR